MSTKSELAHTTNPFERKVTALAVAFIRVLKIIVPPISDVVLFACALDKVGYEPVIVILSDILCPLLKNRGEDILLGIGEILKYRFVRTINEGVDHHRQVAVCGQCAAIILGGINKANS